MIVQWENEFFIQSVMLPYQFCGVYDSLEDAMSDISEIMVVLDVTTDVECSLLTTEELAAKLIYPEHMDLDEGQEFYVNDHLYTVRNRRFIPLEVKP